LISSAAGQITSTRRCELAELPLVPAMRSCRLLPCRQQRGATWRPTIFRVRRGRPVAGQRVVRIEHPSGFLEVELEIESGSLPRKSTNH
jgi:hypothetical protein